jgi:hypothetical protein
MGDPESVLRRADRVRLDECSTVEAKKVVELPLAMPVAKFRV